MLQIACHGGSASSPSHQDGTSEACQVGLKKLSAHATALDAVLAATELLEDDQRFNAGTGSNLRLDGTTIQMDASCMTSDGRFGAVAAIERVRHPVAVAARVLATPHVLLVGEGATAFARQCGFEDHDPTTAGAQNRLRQIMATAGDLGGWTRLDLEKAWNFETPLRQVIGADTVGSVAWDGVSFAGALSSGGTTTVLRGRVGDVPLPGCGLYVGKSGAVATTGDGEDIARALLAYRAYLQLEQGGSPQQTVDWALNELPLPVDVGIIVIDSTGFAGGARHGMAWSGQTVPAHA